MLKSGSMFFLEMFTNFEVFDTGLEDFGLPFFIFNPATKVFEKALLLDFK